MYYFPKHKLAFCHIPKTGGTAISEFLLRTFAARGDSGQEISRMRWHESLAVKRERLGPQVFDDATILASVRNPFAVVVSMYFWCRRKVEENHGDLVDYPEVRTVAAMDFAQFLDWYPHNELPFVHYLQINGKVPPNVHILHLENIDAELDAVLNGKLGLGVKVKVPVLNTSRHGPVMSYLDAPARARIMSYYEWAFTHWYDADGNPRAGNVWSPQARVAPLPHVHVG